MFLAVCFALGYGRISDRLTRLEIGGSIWSPGGCGCSRCGGCCPWSVCLSLTKAQTPVGEKADHGGDVYGELFTRRGGKCLTPEDANAFPNIHADFNECGEQVRQTGAKGLKALGLFETCLSSKGFSLPCTKCQGKLAACKAEKCSGKCGTGADGGKLWEEPCFTCAANCALKMTKCGGLDNVSYEKCSTLLQGESAFLCDVIHGKATIQQSWQKLAPELKPKPGLMEIETDEDVTLALMSLSQEPEAWEDLSFIRQE